ncbi:hypothetical protein M407DRAFT_26488 [Tulasnella calospora MUT 4182]|uniref:MYND-type domain-containing protein n=1 Tax=Tulasnella calospora MUT 4182 TaxID=1051891 RepID=A0A0C3QFP3_9AGAM|nr:hypothetical protein M407DRAFT_26488 [Tulasnella calospora MUT 4182]
MAQGKCVDAVHTPLGGQVTQVGCGWHKCPLYGEDTTGLGIKISRCRGCKLATYCSLACQKADWKAGGHHLVCARHESKSKGLGKAGGKV